jgi:hypothetical protein
MTIPSNNFSAFILLDEIDLQCRMIVRTVERLRGCAQHWIFLDQGIDDGKTEPPIEIFALCTVCLSAAACIHKTLFLGGRNGKKTIQIQKRCDALMNVLENPNLPTINSIIVRNDWEHIDERLDNLLSTKSHKSYSQLHVAAKPPNTNTFALRYYDPKLLEIKYGSNTIRLELLIEEARELSVNVHKAFKRLETESCNVY